MGGQSLVLLDTQALVWLLEGHDALGERARRLADKALKGESLSVSAISFWEIAALEQKRRLGLQQPVSAWRLRVLELGVLELPVSGEIGIAAAGLQDFHPDPADRIITATAALHQATLVTSDDRILGWSGSLRRHDARQ